jgi:hypothetical protein
LAKNIGLLHYAQETPADFFSRTTTMLSSHRIKTIKTRFVTMRKIFRHKYYITAYIFHYYGKFNSQSSKVYMVLTNLAPTSRSINP